MASTSSSNDGQRLLLTAGSLVLVVAALSLARAVLIPIVFAVLLTFVLNPVVNALQRLGLGRIPSVLGVVLLAFCLLGGIGSAVVMQFHNLAADLPQHKDEIEAKIEKVREAARTLWFADVYDTVVDLSRKIQGAEADRGTKPETVPVRFEPAPFPFLETVAGSAMEVLFSAGLTIVLLIFMLIQREDLRNRVIRLWGDSRVTNVTKAFDDAIRRISRYLAVQLAVNAAYGTVLAVGLSIIGVPYPILWGFLAGTLRYIPYIGTWIGALLPIALAVAILPGWSRPLLVLGLFLVLELITYNVVEPWLFGHSIGVSAVALLISAAFWAWLWGPIGLVIATPLTACLAVLGKYVQGLQGFNVLLGDEAVLEPHIIYYQRLLAKDQDEATDLVEEFVQTQPAEQVYDRVLVPALSLLRENRQRGEATAEDEHFILQVTRELVEELQPTKETLGEECERGSAPPADGRVLVLGCPARDEVDELALAMFRQLMDPDKCRLELISHKELAGEIIGRVRQERPRAVCIASVPPKGLAHTRYMCKRLRAQFPDLKIVVGYWGCGRPRPQRFESTSERENQAEERTRERLLGAGADEVSFSLLETRDQLAALVQLQSHIQRREAKATAHTESG